MAQALNDLPSLHSPSLSLRHCTHALEVYASAPSPVPTLAPAFLPSPPPSRPPPLPSPHLLIECLCACSKLRHVGLADDDTSRRLYLIHKRIIGLSHAVLKQARTLSKAAIT